MNTRYLSDIKVLRPLLNRYNMEPNYVHTLRKIIFKMSLGIDKTWFSGIVVANSTFFWLEL